MALCGGKRRKAGFCHHSGGRLHNGASGACAGKRFFPLYHFGFRPVYRPADGNARGRVRLRGKAAGGQRRRTAGGGGYRDALLLWRRRGNVYAEQSGRRSAGNVQCLGLSGRCNAAGRKRSDGKTASRYGHAGGGRDDAVCPPDGYGRLRRDCHGG